MKTAVFPGTFDPPTLGHMEIIERAAVLFDRLYVAVVAENAKHPHPLSLQERLKFLKAMVSPLNNVEVVSFSGLVVDFAEKQNAGFLVRGLRNGFDFEYESQMASANREMTGVETVLLIASPQYSHISSTLIREIAANGRRLEGFVPKIVEEAIFQSLKPNLPPKS